MAYPGSRHGAPEAYVYERPADKCGIEDVTPEASEDHLTEHNPENDSHDGYPDRKGRWKAQSEQETGYEYGR